MLQVLQILWKLGCRAGRVGAAGCTAILLSATAAYAQAAPETAGGEANLKLPDLSSVNFLGINGHKLLLFGILFCVFGLAFGLAIYTKLKNLPVHRAMREISELIYETCKTYLITQGKFLLLLEAFIAVVIVLYFGVLLHYEAARVIIILAFSMVGDSREHVREFAHGVCGTARQAVSDLSHSAGSRDEHRDDADQRGIADDAFHSAVYPGRLRGALFYWICDRRISGSGCAAHRGRNFHQDRRYWLGLDEDCVQDQGGRRAQSGRDCGLHGRQCGRFGGSERRWV